MKLTMLGCGTSTGIPRIGNDWGDCDPAEPRNRRRRVSVMVESGGYRLIIDTTPDLREQLLSVDVAHIDAVFLTHDHADHAHGIDDLRQVYHAMRRPVDIYMSDATWAVMGRRFDYVFTGGGGYPATCRRHPLTDPIRVGPMAVRPFVQQHGPITSTGYRIEQGARALAYSTDINGIPGESEAFIEGLDLMPAGGPRIRRTPISMSRSAGSRGSSRRDRC